jgi:hypothetical protein
VTTGQDVLIAAAKDLVQKPHAATAGIWPRATSLLARQALEATLDAFWRLRAPGLESCSHRAQLLCLPFHLTSRGPQDEELAERVAYTWAALSRACHQHPYELAPTSSELLEWIATVEEFTRRVDGGSAGSDGSGS